MPLNIVHPLTGTPSTTAYLCAHELHVSLGTVADSGVAEALTLKEFQVRQTYYVLTHVLRSYFLGESATC